MKSTIELPDDLLARARQVAQRDGLMPAIENAGWDTIRDEIYSGCENAHP